MNSPFPVTAPSPIPIGTIDQFGRVWDGITWRCPVGIPEAPRDGQLYGRQNATWQLAVSAVNGEAQNLTVDNLIIANALDTPTLNATQVNTSNLEVTSSAGITAAENLTGGALVVYNNVLGGGGAIEAHDVGGPGSTPCLQVYSENTGYLVGFWYGGGQNTVFPSANQIGAITSEDGTTTSYLTTSDGRLKTREQDLDDEVIGDIIDHLQPKSYHWKHERNGAAASVGMIAQEAYAVFPQAVARGRGNVPWMIDYSKFVPLLIAEVKELRKRLHKLEHGSRSR